MQQERILITGASGFIGSFVTEEALRQGMEVWAAVRKGSSTQYLQDERIHFVTLRLDSTVQMTEALSALPPLDYVVHCAALTKALHSQQFYATNTLGTQNLITALEAVHPAVKRLVFISSLSVMGAVREAEPHTPILPTDTPQPNTHYAKSKLQAEQWIAANCHLPYTIMRPTGVYGPREKDYMVMVDSIRRGIDTAAGFSRQDLTFIYVKDVVQAIFLSIKSEKSIGKAYFLSDGGQYSSRDFSDLIINRLKKRHVLRLTVPLWVLRAVCAMSDAWMHISGKPSTLNNDHYNMLRQRNWLCDISAAQADLGFHPRYTLREGVDEMLQDAQ